MAGESLQPRWLQMAAASSGLEVPVIIFRVPGMENLEELRGMIGEVKFD